MSFEIVRNDITRVTADAIVNTANPRPICAGGTDNAIYTAAGKEALLAERRKIGDIEPGQAAVTSAFALHAKYIIHTVGPVWIDGSCGELETLRSCYENSLRLALSLNCRSIAFPLISTGVYGFPKDKALDVAASVIGEFIEKHDMRVILVVFDQKAFVLSGSLADSIREYIDSNYVEQARKAEYAIDEMPLPEEDICCCASKPVVKKDIDAARPRYYNAAPAAPRPSKIPMPVVSAKLVHHAADPHSDIDAMLGGAQKTFQQELFNLMDGRNLTPPDVYKNYISKQVFHKILSDKNYHPNKFTAIALCLSLNLNLDETRDLLERAGWALSPSSRADIIVAGCIKNHEYNLVKIDLLLDEYGCETLDKIR